MKENNQTPAQRLNKILKSIEAKHRELEAAFISQNEMPKSLWGIGASRGGEVEYPVKRFCYIPSAHFAKQRKPAEGYIKAASDYLSEMEAKTIAPAERFFVFVEDNSCGFTCSFADAWTAIGTDNPRTYWTRSEAEAAQSEWESLYKERPNHFRCEQCGKQSPDGRAVYSKIRLHGGAREKRKFCSPQCAAHNQFAQEG